MDFLKIKVFTMLKHGAGFARESPFDLDNKIRTFGIMVLVMETEFTLELRIK